MRVPRLQDAPAVKILLWHGYLLGGTGSNVYTRALAREWSGRGTTSPSSARSRSRSATTSAAPSRCGRTSAGCCRCSCSTATRATTSSSLQDCTRAELDALGRGERGGARASTCRPTSSSRTTCCSAARSGPRRGARFAVKAHGSELEYSMRGQRGAVGVGARRRSRRPRPSSSAPPTSARCSRRSSATSTACTRCRRASTSTSGGREPREEALAGLLDEARRDPPNPGNANERLPDEGNAERLARVPRGRRADRRLLRQAALQQGRPRPARGAPRSSTRAP